MGHLMDLQITISPIFYYCYVDMWGPIKIFCPGFEKMTRMSNTKQYECHMLVVVCAATGMTNCQVIEGKDTSTVIGNLPGLHLYPCL